MNCKQCGTNGKRTMTKTNPEIIAGDPKRARVFTLDKKGQRQSRHSYRRVMGLQGSQAADALWKSRCF